MIFGESALKDVYRIAIWGPWRLALERAPLGAELRANHTLGRLAAHVSRRQAERIALHMRETLGDDRWVSGVFETHFANQYVATTFAKVDHETWPFYLTWQGLEALNQALARGKGVVIAHPHMALPQLPLHVLGLLGHDVHQVAGGRTQQPLSAVGRRVAALRSDLEQRIHAELHDGSAYLRPLIRVLERGGIVFSACDGTGGGREMGRRFAGTVLGREMAIPEFPLWLARKSGATLLFLKPHRSAATPYAAVVSDPLPVIKGEGEKSLATHLDAAIRAHPGDWHFWDVLHDRPGGLLLPKSGAPR